jgi:hypothetical protein
MASHRHRFLPEPAALKGPEITLAFRAIVLAGIFAALWPPPRLPLR